MDKGALIILDLQNFFINEKTKALPRKIKEHINSREYDFIIFSMFINSKKSNFTKKLNWTKCEKSPDIDIVPELSEIASKNQIFEKNTYSIFKSRKFTNFLKKNKISKLSVCGLELDACILASAFEAFDLGFDFEILLNLSDTSKKKDKKFSEKIISKNIQR